LDLGLESHVVVTDKFDDDEPKTPPESPSGLQKLGLEHCPECRGTGRFEDGGTCSLCKGGRRVTREQARIWRETRKT
jgi:hypothetical protein